MWQPTNKVYYSIGSEMCSIMYKNKTLAKIKCNENRTFSSKLMKNFGYFVIKVTHENLFFSLSARGIFPIFRMPVEIKLELHVHFWIGQMWFRSESYG